MLDASKEEAVLAVKLFNDPTGERNLEAFVVHMHLAWLYLIQSEWVKDGHDYRIPDPKHKGRYKKREGEYQTPSLDWFVSEKWNDNVPERVNLEFFIRLRNKIEHRHSGSNESLATVISGECHALLLNYEEALVAVGGQGDSLATVLRFPVFIGGFTDKGKEAIVKLTNALPADLRTFLADYSNTVSDTVAVDPKYRLMLRVVLEAGNRKGDMSMQFINEKDLDEEARKALEAAAEATGYMITKTKSVPVANHDHIKASTAVERVQDSISFVFKMHHFTDAYKIGKFRPSNGDLNPENTRSDFVLYDKAHTDYTYSPAYIEYLSKKCATPDGFRKITGREAVTKPVVTA